MIDDQHKMFDDPVCLLKETELLYLEDTLERAVEHLSEIADQIHHVALKDMDAWPDFSAIRALQHEMKWIVQWKELIKTKLPVKTIDRFEGDSLQ